jgi:hypothetical protein
MTSDVGGAYRPPAVKVDTPAEQTGFYELDLDACIATLVSSAPFPAESKEANVGGSFVLETTTPAGTAVRITGTNGVRLERTRNGTKLPDIELAKGANNWQWTVTADRRHALVMAYAPKPGPMSIVDLETGTEIAKADVGRLALDSMFVGRKLVMGFAVASVFDTDKQRMVWTRTLRTLGRLGPDPPSAPQP